MNAELRYERQTPLGPDEPEDRSSGAGMKARDVSAP
jgi:hypothetical protein